jgi:hypothetical protein
MKRNIILSLCILAGFGADAQLKTSAICQTFTVDILDGKVNRLPVTSTIGQIKEKLPCFTSAEPESATATCGGGVFFKDRDISFYTARDYVEVGPKFKGKLTIPLMGAPRTGLFKWLGVAKIKDINWDAFTMSYGTLILYYNKAGKVNKLQFSTKTPDTIKLCE